MTADVFVELPTDESGLIRIGRIRKDKLDLIQPHEFRGTPGTKAVAFASALLVSRFRVPVTAKSEAEARKAALYAVEDDLAQPVEDVMLVLGPRLPGSIERDVYIVDGAVLERWRRQLIEIGLGHALIVAENSLRSSADAVWNFGNRVLMIRPDECFAADTALGEDAVRGFIDAAGFSGAQMRSAEPLAVLSALHREMPGVQLQSSKAQHTKGLRAWQTAAALAAAGLLIWAVTLVLETRAQELTAQRAELVARQMFRTQFAGAPEPVDVHAEVRRIMQAHAAGNDAGFQSMASALFKVMSASDTIRLQRLSYSAAETALTADLYFANAADEAAFRSRLEPAGLRTDAAEISDTAGGVHGRFTLRSAP